MVYTAFLAFVLLAYVVIGALIWYRTGLTPDTYVEYYRGNEAEQVYGKTFAELLEISHFHLFSYPVFILIQGHIFLLCSWPRSVKVSTVLACFAGAAVYLGAPWLVFYGGAGWVWTQWAGRILMLPPLLLFLVIPLYEMWFKAKRSETTPPRNQ